MAQWGNWSLNKDNYCLEHPGPGCMSYQVPLEDMNNPAIILDWIYQMNEKTWMTKEDSGNLVSALQDIFGRGICGGGSFKSINAKDYLKARYG
ncbi:hypothetical protein JK202_14970 [Gluconobacter sp. Dm-62]|uniref:hypothetical protein n=1 Tax=Gluconobacter sp. Dm-62 TaxID=2799804 RepID=UPI001B8D5607|nr:hypothetical protein [Gluconobacter sp. Dm-62]MBS1104290.1 hypothetical protein [Gluconobacter sp. Dm-62]